ncbi:M48 family metalloprotease [Hyperthermus butylicus]|uniref:Peptidase M48 domain-containing protein n=1 Tax=Hyperthermus butylicus (strain DSM 5456 / JCM 9403 / PLM1-5) TaxID=415426 RepID=A2BLM3_HYPBU|nr:M48 family metalloprotease [Hyperthermus butylicus]ABM80884.1 hypothetical protein Hbut_1040 [Hyperthermus butylicus DSM 5456]
MGGYPVHLLAVLAAYSLTLPAVYGRIVVSCRNIRACTRQLRLLAIASTSVPITGLVLLARIARDILVEAVVAAAAAPIVVAVVARMLFRPSGIVEAWYHGVRVSARLVDIPIPAFSVAVLGRVYLSTRALAAPVHRLCVMIAHEQGHLEAFHPVPVQLAALAPTAAAATALTVLLSSAMLTPAWIASTLLLVASLAIAWTVYSWSWEHLADLHSARICSVQAALDTLAALAGWRTCMITPAKAYRVLVKTLWPRRARGPFLINPHPPPCLRLWLLSRFQLLKTSRPEPNSGWAP